MQRPSFTGSRGGLQFTMMTYKDAAQLLGMHYISIHRLRRRGHLKASPDGVEAASVMAYLRRVACPEGFISSGEAAKRLGIPEPKMSAVAAAKLVEAIRRPGRGWWVNETEVADLVRHPERLAVLGMRLTPPKGWITAHEATQRIGCSRSWLARLARRSIIRRRLYGIHNSWLHEGDVERYRQGRAERTPTAGAAR